MNAFGVVIVIEVPILRLLLIDPPVCRRVFVVAQRLPAGWRCRLCSALRAVSIASCSHLVQISRSTAGQLLARHRPVVYHDPELRPLRAASSRQLSQPALSGAPERMSSNLSGTRISSRHSRGSVRREKTYRLRCRMQGQAQSRRISSDSSSDLCLTLWYAGYLTTICKTVPLRQQKVRVAPPRREDWSISYRSTVQW